ncbi:hypothetical protein C8Q74DRAFT_1196108 [Fomes fomentarius]|nr:hypothetical protein C8Q74DRAFT_1196108 [Fomes fomentarius]
MGNGQQQGPSVPFASFPLTPLSRQQFLPAYYEQWAPKQGAKDNSLLKFEGREIDLYQLHYEVMSAGSYRMVRLSSAFVNQKDLWPVIGAKLGFVNFPGTNTEPGRAGPALAAQLELIYKEFLLEFDQQYLKQLIQHRRAQQLKMKQAGPMDNNGPQQQLQSNGAPMPQSLADIKDPKLIGELVSYSAHSVQDLQQRGVPPQIIQIVETNRDRLKAVLETQRNFRLSAANDANGAPGQQRNVSNPMANAPSQHMGANGQMMPGQPPRPTAVQMQNAIETVKRLRDECKGIGLPPRQVHISDAQRLDYNVAFENLHRMTSEVDARLPHFALYMNEDVIRKLVLMINAVQQQRELLAGQPPKYIMPSELVQTMINQIILANNAFIRYMSRP